MTKIEKENALDFNFAKIGDWIRCEFKEAFPDGTNIDYPHDVYKWTSLNINHKGEARLFYGSHCSTNPSEVMFPDGSTYENAIGSTGEVHVGHDYDDTEIKSKLRLWKYRRYDEIEWLVNHWPSVKAELLRRKEENEALLKFEV